jgi:hypothetical protein
MPLAKPTGHRKALTPAEVSTFFAGQMGGHASQAKGATGAWAMALHGMPRKGVKRKPAGGRP